MQMNGSGVVIDGNDIDTDRIIPARFLKEITFDNMGNYLFYDVRFTDNGQTKEYVLNDPKFQGATILVVGKNFGCGSSREHAAHAIKRYGFNAIIGESFGEIFAGNCTSLGVPPVTVSEQDRSLLASHINASPKTSISIDLHTKKIIAGTLCIPFEMPDSRRNAFISGYWDAVAMLRENMDLIKKKDQELLNKRS